MKQGQSRGRPGCPTPTGTAGHGPAPPPPLIARSRRGGRHWGCSVGPTSLSLCGLVCVASVPPPPPPAHPLVPPPSAVQTLYTKRKEINGDVEPPRPPRQPTDIIPELEPEVVDFEVSPPPPRPLTALHQRSIAVFGYYSGAFVGRCTCVCACDGQADPWNGVCAGVWMGEGCGMGFVLESGGGAAPCGCGHSRPGGPLRVGGTHPRAPCHSVIPAPVTSGTR